MSFGIVSLFPPTLVIIVLHVIKVINLRNSQAIQGDKKKMNTVVSIILGIFIVYNIQKLLIALKIEGLQFLQESVTISALIHHASNPIIYVIFTPIVQKPWQRFKANIWNC
jgi:hypothetical protein